jgi:hypothetical protein
MSSQASSNERENWLNALAKLYAPRFAQLGFPLPQFRVSCGFTSRGSRSNRIGECWAASCSKDAHHEIFINPVKDDPLEVSAILVHELTHAAVGLSAKHTGKFQEVVTAFGLLGPMTSSVLGPIFIAYVTPLLAEVGPYPHAKLDARGISSNPESRSGKLLRAKCPESGYTIYLTKTWHARHGLPLCPCCEGELTIF